MVGNVGSALLVLAIAIREWTVGIVGLVAYLIYRSTAVIAQLFALGLVQFLVELDGLLNRVRYL